MTGENKSFIPCWAVPAVAIYIKSAGSAPTRRDTLISHLPLIYENTTVLSPLSAEFFLQAPMRQPMAAGERIAQSYLISCPLSIRILIELWYCKCRASITTEQKWRWFNKRTDM